MRRAIWIFASLALVAALLPVAASAGDRFNSRPYRQIVTVPNILQHEQQLQSFADANDDTRLAGTPGNQASIDYIAATMAADGWSVTIQPFPFDFFEELAPSSLSRVSPDPVTFENGTDFATLSFSGSGDVTGTVTPVGPLNVPIGNTPAGTTSSGCAAADFAGFPAGNIALIQRGTCTFLTKATNAINAGAIGVVVFNEGQSGRTGPIAGTLGAPVTVPVVGSTYALGADTVERIRSGETVVFRITTSTISEQRETFNVIADSPWGDPNRVVVVSAHSDSVGAGPGINDDGSGASMNLELALRLGEEGQPPRNRVRFIWVGAEEEGLIGSFFYVDSLSTAERSKIIAMLDHDMVASPNYARLVYDGDGSTFGGDVSGPNGSGLIESQYTTWFGSQGLANEPIPFDGRSDYVAFTEAGIPAGGIFTGAEVEKTEAQAALYGGTAGIAFDPCYHQACDDINNPNLKALGEMKDAAADVLYQLMLTRSPIVDGSSIKPGKKAPAPAGTFVGPSAVR